MIFPFALGAGLAGVFLVALPPSTRLMACLIAGGAVAPWVVLSPMLARIIRRRTARSVEDFADLIAGSPGDPGVAPDGGPAATVA